MNSLKEVYKSSTDNIKKYDYATELGDLYRNETPDSAIMYYKQARRIAEDIDDNLKIAKAIKNIGIVYYFKDDFISSSDYYLKALNYLNENDSSHYGLLSKVNNNLGWNYERLEHFKQAEERYKKAINFSHLSSTKENLALIYNNLGVLYKSKGQIDKAVVAYKNSYELNTADNNIRGQLQNLNNLGFIYILKKNYTDAYKYINKALEINYELDDKIEIVNNLENIGRIYIGIKQYNAARDSLLKAKSIAEQVEFSEGHVKTLLLLAQLEDTLKNTELALDLYKRYYSMKDSIYRKEQYKLLIVSETRFNTLKNEKENEILKRESIISENKLRQSKLNNLLIIGGLGLVSVLAILLFLLLSVKQRANKKLRKLYEKIHSQKEEIENQSEELKNINEKVSDQNKELRVSIDELKRTHGQLIQSEKMASLGVLSAGIAHEINNPLNFISGGVEIMMNHLQSYDKKIIDEIKPFSEIIDEGIARTSSIVKSLGNFSRQTAANDELCDIHKIIDNCLVMLYNKTKNRIVIEKDLTENEVIIYGNVGKLHQVFLNILSNAEQAIENEGVISVKTDVTEENVLVYISDTGIGISDENKSKINDPFFTTKDPGAGTGLGLSISYSIIKEHNGSIELESKLKEGATFTITLPKKIK